MHELCVSELLGQVVNKQVAAFWPWWGERDNRKVTWEQKQEMPRERKRRTQQLTTLTWMQKCDCNAVKTIMQVRYEPCKHHILIVTCSTVMLLAGANIIAEAYVECFIVTCVNGDES